MRLTPVSVPTVLTRKRWKILALILLGLGTSITSAEPRTATKLSDGWSSLNAPNFFVQTSQLFAQSELLPTEQQRVLVLHAWERFLNDPQFAAHADWPTIELAMGWPLDRAELRINGHSAAERSASKVHTERDREALRTRLQNRLQRTGELEFLVRNRTYHDVHRAFYRLRWLGIPDLQTRMLCQWIEGEDFRSSSFRELYELNQYFLALAPRTTVRGIRWTGFLTAPVSDHYEIQLARQSQRDPAIKVWVGGTLVLETQLTRDRGDGCDAFYRSQLIQLTAGEKVPVKIEAAIDGAEVNFSHQPPLAVVLHWHTSQVPPRLIPESAYSPPKGFAAGHLHGLQGEYFEDVQLTKPVCIRRDPAIDCMWNATPVAVPCFEPFSLVRDECLRRLQQPDFWKTFSSQETGQLINRELPTLIAQARLPMRGSVIGWLATQKVLVPHVSEETMGRLVADSCLLPEKEHLQLLRAWIETRPQARMVAGLLLQQPRVNAAESRSPWAASLCGPYAQDAVNLAEGSLCRSNGECNLTLVYAMVIATTAPEVRDAFTKGIEENLRGMAMRGDKRTTWLLAKAFVQQASISAEIDPSSIDAVEATLVEAINAAESPKYRFWALEELVDRLVILGQPDRVIRVLNQFEPTFTDSTSRGRILDWRIGLEHRRHFSPLPGDQREKIMVPSGQGDQFKVAVLKPAAREVTLMYSRKNYIGPGVPVPDGFVDGDCAMQIHSNEAIYSSEEVMVVDRQRDAILRRHIAFAKSEVMQALSPLERARRLAGHVAATMTPPGGAILENVNRMANRLAGREVLLGDLPAMAGGAGVCRHRALLFKVLADEAGLRVALVRGSLVSRGGHAWNELYLEDGTVRLVDVMRPQPGFEFPRTDEPSSRIYVTLEDEPWYALDSAVKTTQESRKLSTSNRSR